MDTVRLRKRQLSGLCCGKTITSYASLGNGDMSITPLTITVEGGKEDNIKGQTTYTYDRGA